jgi:hypothetical protein
MQKAQISSSFLSLTDNEIMCKASKLGVSLGASDSQIASSIKNIKNIEVDRRISYLKNNLHLEMDMDPT